MVALEYMPRRVRILIPRVEMLGVFGSGKTTLATALAKRTHRILAENEERNAFWGDQEATGVVGYLAYDLSFLLQHVYLACKTKPTRANEIGICDWSFVSDRLWAAMRLGKDLAIYDLAYRTLIERVDPPLGYLYLRLSAREISARLRKRQRQSEARLEPLVAAAVERLDELARSLPSARIVAVEDTLNAAQFQSCVRRWLGESKHG
jgi:deoxyadenosine/deoxycytidine kinase